MLLKYHGGWDWRESVLLIRNYIQGCHWWGRTDSAQLIIFLGVGASIKWNCDRLGRPYYLHSGPRNLYSNLFVENENLWVLVSFFNEQNLWSPFVCTYIFLSTMAQPAHPGFPAMSTSSISPATTWCPCPCRRSIRDRFTTSPFCTIKVTFTDFPIIQIIFTDYVTRPLQPVKPNFIRN